MGQVRLIGGVWRGRRVQFSDELSIRPTPDRIRETLFNWLAPYLVGSRCLDLFSGSGALGFEALSRGAREVLMVDQSLKVLRQLVNTAISFGGELIDGSSPARNDRTIHFKDTDQTLQLIRAQLPKQFRAVNAQRDDIVFLDPPYRQGLLDKTLAALSAHDGLSHPAWIYIEVEADLTLEALALPSQLHLHREKKAGQVRALLFKVH